MQVHSSTVYRGEDAILNIWSVLVEKVTPEQRFNEGKKLGMQVSIE